MMRMRRIPVRALNEGVYASMRLNIEGFGSGARKAIE